MCGIAGFWKAQNTTTIDKKRSQLDQMLKSLIHRGPDANGQWMDSETGIFLGHTRLSILDLSDAGAQPMTSHNGRYILTFNGEIYNYQILRSELPQDTNWSGNSDTEVLLEYLSHFGLHKTLENIKGMFAFALWDKKELSLTLAGDHVGKKPLYFGRVGNQLAFASELKSIQVLANASLTIDQQAFAHYSYYGFIPAPRSIYKGIYKLPPAHYVTLYAPDHDPNMVRYWQAKKTQPVKNNNLKKLLSSAVHDRMISDVPLGAFLSGGIDSSLVTALMQENSTKPIKTYSIGFSDQAFDESRHAEKIAAHLGTDHTTYHVNEAECLNIIPDLPQIYDEPFADYSQIPTVALCREARKDTIVALSGDGGDEVFCGYKRYFLLKKLLDTTKYAPRSMIATAIKTMGQGTYNRLGINGKRMHSIAGFLSEKTLESAILRTLSINPDARQPDLNLHLDEPLHDLERMQMIDTHLYLPDDILVKVDRASMSTSLEVRSPLLDKDVIEYAWSLPINDKIFNGQGRGKRPLHELLCEYVPEYLINRPKQGFTPPIARWLRTELKDWAHDLIHTDTGLYEPAYMRGMWNNFQQKRVDNHTTIWTILMAQSWLLHNKQPSATNA